MSSVLSRPGIYDAERRPVVAVELDDEEDTEPGVGPNHPPYPFLAPNRLKHPPRCYLCARPTDAHLHRGPSDVMDCCSLCTVHQLGYVIHPDGALTRRPDDAP